MLIIAFLVSVSSCNIYATAIKNTPMNMNMNLNKKPRNHHRHNLAHRSSISTSNSIDSDETVQVLERLLPTSLTVANQLQTRGGDTQKNKDKDTEGTASLSTSIFNLANNVAGAGLLTLAAGKAAGVTGWVPSILICCSLAYMSSTTFILIGKACELTGERTFKGLWSQAFGSGTAYIVDSIVFVQCFLSSTIYIGLLGDIFSALLKGVTVSGNIGNVSGLQGVTSRTGIILLVAASILFPLNLIKNLSALAFTSILGLCAVMYTVLFMVFRALDGSYSLGAGAGAGAGKFIVDKVLDPPPSFALSTLFNFDLRSLVLISNFGLAFIAHYNAPSYYREMKKDTSESFPTMVRTSYAILALIYATAMCAGYATFGDSARGNILLNYHPKDVLALLGRLATGLSVIFGFPLVSNGAREGLKNASMALGYPAISDPKNHMAVVLGMLTLGSIFAILVKDIKVIAGFSGAAMGSFLVYICPPLIYTKILKNMFGGDSLEYKRGRRYLAFVPFGLFIGVMGVTMTYKSM